MKPFFIKNYIAKSKIPSAGIGVFAGKNYKKNDIVEIAPFLEVDLIGNENILSNYQFQSHINPDKAVVIFGYGSMYNHSRRPNLKYYYEDINNRSVQFQATRDIKKGDELTINYGMGHTVQNKIPKKSNRKKISKKI